MGRSRYLSLRLLVTPTVTVLIGCATGGTPAADSMVSPEANEVAEAEALYLARMDSATMRFTDADVRFTTGMISHHAQALVMSAYAPANGARPSVRTLAARIINAQKDEIATMQQWLRDRGQPVPEVNVSDGHVMVHGQEYTMQMPGMLSSDQLAELERAKGVEFDRLFLTYMIQHHQGAVVMVHELFATNGAAQDEAIFKLASDIQVDQLTEIARMEQMLDALPTGSRNR